MAVLKILKHLLWIVPILAVVVLGGLSFNAARTRQLLRSSANGMAPGPSVGGTKMPVSTSIGSGGPIGPRASGMYAERP